MDKKLFGFIIYNGTIFLNKANVQVGISTEDTFVTYFTLLHEIMHALSRLYRGNKNYLIDTGEFLKNNIKKVDESGEYFDQKFVLGLIKGIRLTSIEANPTELSVVGYPISIFDISLSSLCLLCSQVSNVFFPEIMSPQLILGFSNGVFPAVIKYLLSLKNSG